MGIIALLSGGISAPLGKDVEIANQLANGNLLVAIPQTGSDEIGQLLSAM